MNTAGIICEYNPLHRGHKRQLRLLRAEKGKNCGVVCLMSGNFVQRGAPALIDKSLRAKAAVLCGADLVLELPIPCALSSAEGFAAGGVAILSQLCDTLCFGAETGDGAALMEAAEALLSPRFSEALQPFLAQGLSFPAARQRAMEAMGENAGLLSRPNDILAVEYCKAILASGSALRPLPIVRPGDYHSTLPDPESPSATAVREAMLSRKPWFAYVPEEAAACFTRASLHTMEAGERAALALLRQMKDADFEALPYGSEGLWRKLMHSVRQCATVEEILTSVKSKRYTHSRLDRMLLCALLGLTAEDMAAPPAYARVLAFNSRGREILRQYKKSGFFPNAGEAVDHPGWALEQRAGDLYGLFAVGSPEPPGTEARRRVYVHPSV